MKSPCRNTALALMLCFITGLFIPRADTEAGQRTLNSLPAASGAAFQMEPFYGRVRQLVMRYYPDATFERRGNHIRFASETRAFIESFDARDASPADAGHAAGDRAASLDCDLIVLSGHARPAAASLAPTSASGTLLSSPYSPTLDAHLEARIRHAAAAPPAFLSELSDLVADFGTSVTRR